MVLIRTENLISIQTLATTPPGTEELMIRQIIMSHLSELPLDYLKGLVGFRKTDPREPECWDIAEREEDMDYLLHLKAINSVKIECRTSLDIE